MNWLNQIHIGDCRRLMRQIIADGVKVNCVVSSPPYWGLRDYGIPGQFGLERTWIRHVARTRSVFRLVWELLEDDGVLFLNYGDSYYSPRVNGGVGANSTINGKASHYAFRDAQRAGSAKQRSSAGSHVSEGPRRRGQPSLKPKDLVGMPWRIAFALQEDGWYLRSDIIWHKPCPMPESVQDRPTKSHEYVFMLTKSERYRYNAEAIKEPASTNTHPRGKAGDVPHGWATGSGSHTAVEHARPGVNPKARTGKQGVGRGTLSGGNHHQVGFNARWRNKQNESYSGAIVDVVPMRNVRSVWTMPSAPFSGAHFATFPPDLVRRCILAGCPVGGVVFDPFIGSGTCAQVADELGRRWLGCEINPQYAAMYGRDRAAQIGMGLG